jgi:branched-chain amino acid transport system substrate-binding protein
MVVQHTERFNEPPDIFVESGFSSAAALMTALEKTQGSTDTDQLIAALEGMSFDGPKGQYTIRAKDHQAIQPMYLAELVSVPGKTACEPRLIHEVSAEDSAPPLH